jgi:RimJ/RimL family protein N-acetyltransferase
MRQQKLKAINEIFLQAPQLSDVEQVQRWFKEPELKEYFRRYPPLEQWRLPEQTLQGLGSALTIWEGSKLVGLCQSVNEDFTAKSVEIGLMIDKTKASDRWDVSQEAYRQLCEYLFNGLGYNKLYMKVLPHRDKLIKRLSDAGWRVEGILRQGCKFQGKLADECLLGFLKQDFETLKKAGGQ